MMGAGFGGFTINLIMSETVDEVISAMKPLYEARFNVDLKVYHTRVSNGTELVNTRIVVAL